MTKIFKILLLVVLGSVMFAETASARRIRLPFALPGSSESVVLVKDLPDIAALKRKDGRYVDLGYKFNRFSGGSWVGYVGSSSRYLKLNKNQLRILMAIGGVKKLPPVPKRSFASSMGGPFTLGLIGLGVVVMGWRFVKRFAGFAARLGSTANRGGAAAAIPAEQGLDTGRIDAAIRAQVAATADIAPAPQAAPARPASPYTGFGGPARPARAFGQRV